MMKKGQGLSLNVIIVAALALIVLVVLIAVFTGRIGLFTEGVSKEAGAELAKMKITYGECEPTTAKESDFMSTYSKAADDTARGTAADAYEKEIARCKSFDTEQLCGQGACKW